MVSKTSQHAGAQNTSINRWLEELRIPFIMLLLRNKCGLLTRNNATYG